MNLRKSHLDKAVFIIVVLDLMFRKRSINPIFL